MIRRIREKFVVYLNDYVCISAIILEGDDAGSDCSVWIGEGSWMTVEWRLTHESNQFEVLDLTGYSKDFDTTELIQNSFKTSAGKSNAFHVILVGSELFNLS